LALERDFDFLLQHLKLVYAGTNIATMKHDKAIPEHALATSLLINRAVFNNIEIDLNTALEYLRRNAILLSDQPRGYALLTFQNIPIGWVNVLENRVNNLYPQEWRIRLAR
jgi:NOL1/NOP2/fmu family ribosome biogenesis protein